MDGELYRPLIEDMVWSHSRLKCFEDCRYRWYLKYIKKLPEVPLFYSSYGKFIHELLAKYYGGKADREQIIAEYVTDFQSEVTGERPAPAIAGRYFREGYESLQKLSELPYRPVAVEQRIVAEIGGRPFVGILDYLGEADGKLHVVDHKSADIKPRSKSGKRTKKDEELDGRMRQLYLYAEAVRQKYGSYPASLCLNCFRTGTVICEEFDKEKLDEAIEWAKQTEETILDTEDFFPTIDYYPCRFICGQKDNCCYNEGGMAYQE